MPSNKLDHTKLWLSYDGLIKETRQVKAPRKLLSEDDYAYLNQIWQTLSIGTFLKVTYYHIDHYLSIIGPLTRIDSQCSPRLKIKEKWIKISDISDIKVL